MVSHFKSLPLTNVKVKGKSQFPMRKNRVEFEKKYPERTVSQMIIDAILINEQKPVVQGHITCK